MGPIWHKVNRQIYELAISVFSSASWGLQCLVGKVVSPSLWGMPLACKPHPAASQGSSPLPALPCDKLLRKCGVRAKQWQVTVTELYKHVDN